MVEVGEADKGLEHGGGRCPDLRPYIIGNCAVGPDIQIRDVGDDATHQEGVGRIPPQGGPHDDREATS